jgi:hypothetical protein
MPMTVEKDGLEKKLLSIPEEDASHTPFPLRGGKVQNGGEFVLAAIFVQGR